jgi:hypothetical protein
MEKYGFHEQGGPLGSSNSKQIIGSFNLPTDLVGLCLLHNQIFLLLR